MLQKGTRASLHLSNPLCLPVERHCMTLNVCGEEKELRVQFALSRELSEQEDSRTRLFAVHTIM